MDRYEEMSDSELEEVAHDRAALNGASLVVESREDGWFAGFVVQEDPIVEAVVVTSAEGAADRLTALISLLRADDLTRR